MEHTHTKVEITVHVSPCCPMLRRVLQEDSNPDFFSRLKAHSDWNVPGAQANPETSHVSDLPRHFPRTISLNPKPKIRTRGLSTRLRSYWWRLRWTEWFGNV